jgi:S1-C subfamily serine protease
MRININNVMREKKSEMRNAIRVLLAVFAFASGGCVGPLVPVVKLDQESAMRLRKEIRVFDIAELQNKEYRRIGQIEATSCMNKLWDSPASREDAMDQLRYKASALGGNGITNLTCEQREGTNLAKNCWNSVTCYGVAIVLGSAGEESPKRSQETTKSSGTGFVVSSGGYIVTNQHVIEGCSKVTVSISGITGNAAVLREDSINDLALLKLSESNVEPLAFRSKNRLRAGEAVVVLGFPLSGLLSSEPQVTTGTITALAGIRDDTRFLQISAAVQPGSSGGPVFDSDGNVIGMVVSKLDAIKVAKATGDIPQNVNFAINAAVIKGFLDASGIIYKSQEHGSLSGVPEIAEMAKRSIAYIECSK